jgi:hypothetical protein
MGRRSLTYPGDSPQKADSRNMLYRTVKSYWKAKPSGDIIVLAGHEAKDVSPLRDYLRWPASRVLFVDIDARGLARAQQEWPGVRVYHGDIGEALKQVKQIALLNLDFMGLFNEDVEAALAAAEGKISLHGVVAYTFYRGREHRSQHSLQKNLFAARRHIDLKTSDYETMRWVAAGARLQRGLTFENPELLLTHRYRSASAAMGMLAIANEPKAKGSRRSK